MAVLAEAALCEELGTAALRLKETIVFNLMACHLLFPCLLPRLRAPHTFLLPTSLAVFTLRESVDVSTALFSRSLFCRSASLTSSFFILQTTKNRVLSVPLAAGKASKSRSYSSGYFHVFIFSCGDDSH